MSPLPQSLSRVSQADLTLHEVRQTTTELRARLPYATPKALNTASTGSA